jgi:hypothetical protein|tara:strand:+ start:147 stop:662 length:516 start_codon:yes stop_codon:yes gene_type:complete
MNGVKGITTTSSIITISGRIDELAANTFVTDTVSLALNPLDREAFVVYAVQSDIAPPDAIGGVNTGITLTLSTTARASTGGLNNSNVFHQHILQIRSGAPGEMVSFAQSGPDSASTALPYLAIIATDNFHANLQGFNNTSVLQGQFKVYGQRVRLEASQYAALVQSELLSI